MQIWLRPNVRVLWLQLIGAIVVAAVGVALGRWGVETSRHWLVGLGGALVLVGAALLWPVARDGRRARIGYDRGRVLFGIARHGHIAVPLEVVECFFLGKGEVSEGPSSPQSMNVVVRLAEAARQWHEYPVDPRLARWCGGHITLFGLWCEPLGPERVGELNHRLAAAKRAKRQEEAGGPTGAATGQR